MLQKLATQLIKWVTPSGYLQNVCDTELSRLRKVYSDENTIAMLDREKESQALLLNAKEYHRAGLNVVRNTERIRYEEKYFDIAARQTIKTTNRAIAAARNHGFNSPEAQSLMEELTSCTDSIQALPLQQGQHYFVPSQQSGSASTQPLPPSQPLPQPSPQLA
jgi:hypothetical protein